MRLRTFLGPHMCEEQTLFQDNYSSGLTLSMLVQRDGLPFQGFLVAQVSVLLPCGAVVACSFKQRG